MGKKLTVIVGAGASKELGLPIGSELKEKIASLLDIRFDFRQQQSGDARIVSALRLAVEESDDKPDIGSYIKAAGRIRDAMPQSISIDNFIDNHQGDRDIELCGKLAIVKSILDAERRSALYINPEKFKDRINYAKTEGCWLNPFTRVLTENCRIFDLEDRLKSVSFIIFNYDRCIEHYLYHALQNFYGLSAEEVAKLLSKVHFLHPYGSVGTLPWQGQSNVAHFGEELYPQPLLNNARKIKTFTEGTDPKSSEVCEIRDSVAKAESLLFLGFSFHKLNMKLIHPDTSCFDDTSDRRNFATAFGLSNSDCTAIADEIRLMRSSSHAEIRNDLKCSAIFGEYTRGISLTSLCNTT